MLNAALQPLGTLTLWNNTLFIKKEIIASYYTIKNAQIDGGCVLSAHSTVKTGRREHNKLIQV